MSYPDQLAAGLTVQDAFVPFDLFAGEANIVTDQGFASAAGDLEQFRVVARDEAGKLIKWDPAGGAATGALTFSGTGTAADTITINGTVITLEASGASGHQANVGGTATVTAQNVKAVINADPDAFGVTASGAAAVLTLTAIEAGVAGNSITTTEAGTNTSFGAATLTGGSDVAAGPAIGITAQPIPAGTGGPLYTGGIFNHEALVWPASVTTIAARKAAFDGTNIGVRQLR